MAERRQLIEGLKSPSSPVDAQKETAFVYGSKGKNPDSAAHSTGSAPATAQEPTRVPLSTRMRNDFATALKRASLERQLNNIKPNTLTDILEEAVEPWLRSNGYLK
jgi:hypothetical protein